MQSHVFEKKMETAFLHESFYSTAYFTDCNFLSTINDVLKEFFK